MSLPAVGGTIAAPPGIPGIPGAPIVPRFIGDDSNTYIMNGQPGIVYYTDDIGKVTRYSLIAAASADLLKKLREDKATAKDFGTAFKVLGVCAATGFLEQQVKKHNAMNNFIDDVSDLFTIPVVREGVHPETNPMLPPLLPLPVPIPIL